ncbi:hypothetical protein GQR58_005976 [Nymphon striatum]|nr:hypothetical protein GQR58_005976 [Nymphon striatum]
MKKKSIPLPSVTWRHRNKLIDDSFRRVSDKIVRNELLIHKLSRDMLGEKLKCEASNTNLTTPLRRSVIIDMYLTKFMVAFIQAIQVISQTNCFIKVAVSTINNRCGSKIS